MSTPPVTFTIHKDPHSEALRITRDHNPRHSLRVDDLRQLLLLRSRINQYLDDLQPDAEVPSDLLPDRPALAVISTTTARRIAQQRGVELPSSTILSACRSGHLPSAHKRGGRWFVDRDEFESWLANYSPHSS